MEKKQERVSMVDLANSPKLLVAVAVVLTIAFWELVRFGIKKLFKFIFRRDRNFPLEQVPETKTSYYGGLQRGLPNLPLRRLPVEERRTNNIERETYSDEMPPFYQEESPREDMHNFNPYSPSQVKPKPVIVPEGYLDWSKLPIKEPKRYYTAEEVSTLIERGKEKKLLSQSEERKPIKPNAWLNHVQRIREANPGIHQKEILKFAKDTYERK